MKKIRATGVGITTGILAAAVGLSIGVSHKEKGEAYRTDLADTARQIYDNDGTAKGIALSRFVMVTEEYSDKTKAQTDVLDAYWFFNEGPTPREQAAAACLGILTVNAVDWPQPARDEYKAAVDAENTQDQQAADTHYINAAGHCLYLVNVPDPITGDAVAINRLDGYRQGYPG
jgi:hypothetical protein